MPVSSDFVFEDPPVRVNSWGKWIGVLAPLKKHKGRWAKFEMVSVSASSVAAHHLKVRRVKREDGFEFRSSGKFLYARYVGGKV
jgi:hypothetical protein